MGGKRIMLYTEKGKPIFENGLEGHTGPIYTIALIGQHVWSGSWDTRVILWDAEYQQFLKEFEAHTDVISCIINVRENRQVWSGSFDLTIRAWEKTPSAT